MAEISWGFGATINTGNYNSVRLDAHIKLPCPISEIDAVMKFAQGWVDDKLSEKYEEVKKEYGIS